MEELQGDYYVAKVQFGRYYGSPAAKGIYAGDKVYSYKTNILFKPEDFAVVLVDGKFKVVKIIQLISNPTHEAYEKATKWIVQKVDLTEYEEREKAEKLQKRIIKKLDDRLKTMQRIKVYEQMAQDDPEMKALLKELGDLNPKLIPSKSEV